MSEQSIVDVAHIQLRESCNIDDKPTGLWMSSADYRMAYEEDTDKMVVQRRGGLRVFVVPWTNIKCFELDRQQVAPAATPAPAGKETGDGPAPAPRAVGAGRRARPPQ